MQDTVHAVNVVLGSDVTSLCIYLGLLLYSSAHGVFRSPVWELCLLWTWWKLICCVDFEKEERQGETRNNSCLLFFKPVMILLHWLRPLRTPMAHSWLCVQWLYHTGLAHGLLNTLLGWHSKAAHQACSSWLTNQHLLAWREVWSECYLQFCFRLYFCIVCDWESSYRVW